VHHFALTPLARPISCQMPWTDLVKRDAAALDGLKTQRRGKMALGSPGRGRGRHDPYLQRRFAEWGEVFGAVATALLNLLLHHAVVIQVEQQTHAGSHAGAPPPIPTQPCVAAASA
jgi:hypothetical protein